MSGHGSCSFNTCLSRLSSSNSHHSRNSDRVSCRVLNCEACRSKSDFQVQEFRDWQNNWKVQEFRERLLGNGNRAFVCFGVIGDRKAAIKIFNEKVKRLESFRQQAPKLTSLDHPNIVRIYSVSSNPREPLKMATEYMSNGTLQGFLKTSIGQSLGTNDLGYMAYQVATGMEHLEASNLVHSNITSSKVLVGDDLETKVSDARFYEMMEVGEGCYCRPDDYPIRQSLTKWTAPECIGSRRFTIKGDVWSYGILLWVLFTRGQSPYPGIDTQLVLEKLKTGNYRMKIPDHVPVKIQNLMIECWNPVPERRPSFASLKSELKSYYRSSNSSKCSSSFVRRTR